MGQFDFVVWSEKNTQEWLLIVGAIFRPCSCWPPSRRGWQHRKLSLDYRRRLTISPTAKRTAPMDLARELNCTSARIPLDLHVSRDTMVCSIRMICGRYARRRTLLMTLMD